MQRSTLTSTFDADLIGLWTAGGQNKTDINASGEMFLVDTPQPYALGAGGQTLTFLNTNPLWVSDRLSGDPADITGLWERFEADGSDTWREEWLLRANGTYTVQWALNGVFDSEFLGTFVHDATEITTRERRAQITTGPGDQIVLSQFFGPTIIGTYTVAADKQSWSYTAAGNTVAYTRIV